MALNAEITGHIEKAIGAKLDPALELLKALDKPARREGLSPADYMAKMTDGGRTPGFVGPDGAFHALPPVMPGPQRSLGWGPMWKDLACLAKPDLTTEPLEAVHKRVTGSVEQGGRGLVLKAALAEGSGATGGYTVRPEMSDKLLAIAAEDAIVAPRATKMPLTGKELSIPSLDHTSTGTTGQSPFLGGLVAYWTSEAATRTESEPSFRQVKLTAWELSFYSLISNNLLADNVVGLDTFLTTLFGKAIEWYTEYAYLNGDGVAKPRGIVGAPATVSVSRGTSSRVRWVDVLTMRSRLLASSWDRAVWAAHPSTFVDLGLMHDSAGNATAFGFGRSLFVSVDQGAAKAPPETLFGRPIYYTEKLPILGTAGDLVLFDPSYYLLGQRMEVEIAVSGHSHFTSNQLAYRVVFRGDGRPWLNDAITLGGASGTHTVSPFVTLS